MATSLLQALRPVIAAALWCVAQQAWAILPIESWQTASGAKVYFVANRSLPMLDISVDFPAGSAYDTRDKSGVAAMTHGLLRMGADGLAEDDIARRFADVGAVVGGRFDSDRAGLSLRTLSDVQRRGPALELFARILRAPEFPATVLDREKVRQIGALKEADLKPDTQAGRTFYRLLYREHPYALRSVGDVDTVGAITRADLVSFYQRHYVANRAVIAIMGDVSRAEAEAIAEQVTGGLQRATGAAPALPPVESLEGAITRLVAHPAAQSHILIGAPGIRRDDPDYFPLFVGNYILGGGGFVSRITEEVRQKRGLAYSAYSYFSPLQARGPFVIGMQTRRDQADEALAVVRKTLRDFVSNGPTAEELQAAKQNIVGGFPMRIDSNRKIHEYLSVIGFYGLPISYLEDFVGNVERVTVADIKSAFVRHVNPDQLVTVVVGADKDETLTTPVAR
ncbi:MAG: insulinase family protein [Betaproteobacteria bacterium]|nr:MAG: insulinase family protein [Betaproteobacteria bacterium]